MLVLGYDLESEGLLVAEHRILEIGAILYDTDAKQPLRIYNSFIRPSVGEPLPSEYISPTGIKGEWLTNHGVSLPEAMGEVQRMIAAMEPAIVVAHNGLGFDKPMTLAELERYQIQDHGLASAHWLDTRQDLPFEKEPSSRKLIHLAADHGFLNPFPHRAISDVFTMLKVLEQYDFAAVLANSKIPLITVRALVTYEMQNERQGAKELRYTYSGPPKKIWTKQIRENALERETIAAAAKGFEIVKV